MQIDENAPVTAFGDIVIAAPPETVWDIIAAISRWPEWNPEVRSAVLDGELAPGTVFRWKAGPGTITSTLRTVDRPREISWTGKMMSIKAVHAWEITPDGGASIVRTSESFDGLLARLFRKSMQRTLDRTIANALAALKAEADRHRT